MTDARGTGNGRGGLAKDAATAGSLPQSASAKASGSFSHSAQPQLSKNVAKPELRASDLVRSGKLTTAVDTPAPAGSVTAIALCQPRMILGAGGPEPPISVRPDGLSSTLAGAGYLEHKRITP